MDLRHTWKPANYDDSNVMHVEGVCRSGCSKDLSLLMKRGGG